MSFSATDTLTDSELIERVAAQDIRAFEAIYDRYQAQAFGLAIRVTGRATAEEVTQDAFLSLWRGASSYDASRGGLRTWLLTLVHHRGIDSLRRTARHDRNVTPPDPIVERLEAPERTDDQAVRREQSQEVRLALTTLPADQRQAIELAYFAGLTQTEIAAKVGVPLGTIKGRIRLALTKLSRTLATESPLAKTG